MVEPPFEAGALKYIVACVFPAVTEIIVGAPGTVEGVSAVDAVEVALVPAALIALVLKV